MRYPIILALLVVTACGNPMIDDATDAVRAELADGPSATFRSVTACPSGQGYYGQVSSIDRYGVRTRFINFIYDDGEAALAGVGEDYGELREVCAARAG